MVLQTKDIDIIGEEGDLIVHGITYLNGDTYQTGKLHRNGSLLMEN